MVARESQAGLSPLSSGGLADQDATAKEEAPELVPRTGAHSPVVVSAEVWTLYMIS